jgi:hypothetical protein
LIAESKKKVNKKLQVSRSFLFIGSCKELHETMIAKRAECALPKKFIKCLHIGSRNCLQEPMKCKRAAMHA